MLRPHTYYSPRTHVFPDDFPQRLERFKVESSLSWAEIARRLRTYPLTIQTLEVQRGTTQPGSSGRAP